MSFFLLARGPPCYCHLQRPVGGQERGLQHQVRHGAGLVFAFNPALDGFSLIGVPVCGAHTHTHTLRHLTHAQTGLFSSIGGLTCSNDGILHQLSGDWTQKLVGAIGTTLLGPQGPNFPQKTTAEAHGL